MNTKEVEALRRYKTLLIALIIFIIPLTVNAEVLDSSSNYFSFYHLKRVIEICIKEFNFTLVEITEPIKESVAETVINEEPTKEEVVEKIVEETEEAIEKEVEYLTNKNSSYVFIEL